MADGLQSPYAAAVHTCGADVNAREGARRRSRTGVNHAARGDEGKPMTTAPPFSLVAGQALWPIQIFAPLSAKNLARREAK